MVKNLDNNNSVMVDHVGWRLWNASRLWKEEFGAAMVAAGYPWFHDARSDVIPNLNRSGTRQALLVARMGLSKQAVQQLVDQLVEDGVLERKPDPDDKRGKIIIYTKLGNQMISDANRVKFKLEKNYRERLGEQAFKGLMNALGKLNET
jgi:DNA-binding MarR family transcriptional regulator